MNPTCQHNMNRGVMARSSSAARIVRSCTPIAILLLTATAARAQQQYQAVPVYAQHCAQCHDRPEASRAPSRDELRERTPEAIVNALTTGRMSVQGNALTERERRAVAVLLSGRPFGTTAAIADATAMPNRCESKPDGNLLEGPSWNGWSNGVANTRFQPNPGFTAAQVPQLTLKWAFAVPNDGSAKGQPTVVGGRVYTGSDAGVVYAIDAASGCVYWSFQAKAGVRTAINVGAVKMPEARTAVYFGDLHANVYALNATTGSLLWMVRVETHPLAQITGTPTLYAGRLYVPVSSIEEAAAWPTAKSQQYECCTFRGSLVALDAVTGRQIWKSYTIPSAPAPTKKTSNGTQLYGPSGASLWSAPTIDVERRLIYVGTGNAYSGPAEGSTDAVIAFNLDTGKRRWVRQVTANDVFIYGCDQQTGLAAGARPPEACPDPLGPDFDFGGSGVLLATLPNGRTILTAGQKSGIAYGFDPARKGKVLWQLRVGKGEMSGGVVWGAATDGERAYFATNDRSLGANAGGLSAVNLADGTIVWSVKPRCAADQPCVPAQPGAVTLVPGMVFSGAGDGVLRAYSTADGRVAWEFDVKREFQTVNKVPAKGGGLGGPGAVIAGGLLLIPTNNVLLAFTVQPSGRIADPASPAPR